MEQHAELFFLFSETEPSHAFIKENKVYSESELNDFFVKILKAKKKIECENYIGFYDSENVLNYLTFYSDNEYYLSNPKRKLHRFLKGYNDWRESRESKPVQSAKLFYHDINDNSFCELVVRKEKNDKNKYIIISIDALSFKDVFLSVVFKLFTHQIDLVQSPNFANWFCKNRIPVRKYHPSPKHGENGKGEHPDASKLLCSHIDAEKLLVTAVGANDVDELYNFDSINNKYIVFRYEGDNPQNQYHAYHVSNESDVPSIIKELIVD